MSEPLVLSDLFSMPAERVDDFVANCETDIAVAASVYVSNTGQAVLVRCTYDAAGLHSPPTRTALWAVRPSRWTQATALSSW